MMKASLITAATCLTLSSIAAADFVSVSYNVQERVDNIDGQTYSVLELFANFDNEADTLLNVLNANITTADSLGFHQNDGFGGTFNPIGSNNPAQNATDSYVLVGGLPGFGGSTTTLDPNFGAGMGAYVPANAGWYTGDPTAAASGTSIPIGQFSILASRVTVVDFASFSMEIGYNDSEGNTKFGQADFTWGIPAPGALALLGLGGIVSRRRRA